MESLILVLIFLGLLAVIVTIFAVSKRLEQKRIQAIEGLASELGLTYVAGGNSDLKSRLERFEFFNQGRDQRMNNLIWADSGEVKLSIFDYRFTTGSGKNTAVHKATIAVIESKQLKLPRFSLRPEIFLDKIGSVFGFQDIDFETHPIFSKSFVLQSVDETGVRKLMQPKVLEFFEALGPVTVEGAPDMLFFFRSRGFVNATEIKPLLADAYSIFGCFVDSINQRQS